MNPPAPVLPPPTRRGTCMECNAERVRLIDAPLPGCVAQRLVCAVCAAKPSPTPKTP